MPYPVRFHPDAEKELLNIPQIAQDVRDKLEYLKNTPVTQWKNIDQLQGVPKVRKFTVRKDYRVCFTFEGSTQTIRVILVGDRKEVYRNLKAKIKARMGI